MAYPHTGEIDPVRQLSKNYQWVRYSLDMQVDGRAGLSALMMPNESLTS
jgi:hypothetical protein